MVLPMKLEDTEETGEKVRRTPGLDTDSRMEILTSANLDFLSKVRGKFIAKRGSWWWERNKKIDKQIE